MSFGTVFKRAIGKRASDALRCKTTRSHCKTRRAFQTNNDTQNLPRAQKAVSVRLTKGVK